VGDAGAHRAAADDGCGLHAGGIRVEPLGRALGVVAEEEQAHEVAAGLGLGEIEGGLALGAPPGTA